LHLPPPCTNGYVCFIGLYILSHGKPTGNNEACVSERPSDALGML
jgi:hypothetical protein